MSEKIRYHVQVRATMTRQVEIEVDSPVVAMDGEGVKKAKERFFQEVGGGDGDWEGLEFIFERVP